MVIARMDFEDLYESHLKSQRGVIWKGSVARFSLHGAEEVNKLVQELESGKYKPKPPVQFTITKPKKRDILAVSYRDRVYQRWINDALLYPVMTKSFVRENAACQIGKGTKFAMDLMKRNLRRFYINHGLDGYFLQIDVEHYYQSTLHSKVKAMFRKKLDDETYNMVAAILDGQYEGEIGHNPGSQMVQIAGISFLDGVDHFIKEKLRIKEYARVMDDMGLIHEDPEYLNYCRSEIARELKNLGLRCHPKKTKIVPLADGFTFLGFKWRLTETGKIILTPKSETIKDFKKTTEKLMKMYARGERTRRCVEDSVNSRLAYLANGTTWKLRKRLTEWYNERMMYYEQQRESFLQSQRNESAGTGHVRQHEGQAGRIRKEIRRKRSRNV